MSLEPLSGTFPRKSLILKLLAWICVISAGIVLGHRGLIAIFICTLVYYKRPVPCLTLGGISGFWLSKSRVNCK
ncbi:hypothetical protein RSAG8_04564, partial [Rhizoctonia solani AG-8 WAC10335]